MASKNYAVQKIPGKQISQTRIYTGGISKKASALLTKQ